MTVHIAPLPDTETAPPVPDAGLGALCTDRGNLPLDTVDVHAQITGLAAGVQVTQGFRNPYDVPLEATYIFPLPDRAAVTALRMEAADRVIEGKLKERGQAREEYDAALAAGQRAAIAEEDRPDVFTMRVGNILPGERVTVRLTLNQPLPYEDDSATFRFPLVVAPRYIPGTPLDDAAAGAGVVPDTDAVPDASRISPPVLLPGFPNPVRLSLTVELDPAGLPLTGAACSLHVLATDESAGRTTLRLQPGERLNRDFILRLGYSDPDAEPVSLALTPDSDGATGTFTLTVLPTAGRATPRPRDVVLILDRSGSMSGWKMVAARRAAARIIDTLTGADRFAVLSFDHTVERPRDLDKGLATATDRNRFRAVEHLAKLEARGGTEMLSPLLQGAELLADSTGHDRVLVLITDGQVGNEDQILAKVGPALTGVRIHTVGIDRAVNAGFLGRMAGVGQGRFELVESEDRLDEAMEHIHHRIAAPLVTGLSLDWPDLEIEPGTLAPSRLGALFPGVPLVASGRYRGGSAGSVVVHGTTSDGAAWQRRTGGTVTESAPATAIWARAHLRELEDEYTVSGSDELERRIVETSLRFGVLCRFTAFIAVDSRVVTDGKSPHQVIQPVELPDGWAAEAGPMAQPAMPAGFAPMAAPMSLPPPAPGAAGGYGAAPRSGPLRGRSIASRVTRSIAPRPGAAPPQPTTAASPPKPTEHPTDLNQRLRDELDRLTALTDAPTPDRWRHLSDLRTRLAALIQELTDRDTTALTALTESLRIADTPAHWSDLDTLWTRTIQVLTDLTTPSTKKRAFWKKPT